MGSQAYPELLTDRMALSMPPPEEAELVAAYFRRNRDHLRSTSPSRPDGFETEVFWRERLAANRREYDEGKSMRLFLRLRADDADNGLGQFVGNCSYTEIVRGPLQACLLGYGIDAEFQGQGLMVEAVKAGNRYVFERLGLHRIMANHLPANERSARLLRRLGFVVEGYARDYLFLDGAWRDHVLTSLTSPKLQSPTY